AICWARLAAAEGEAIGSDVADGDWHGCSCGNVGGAGRSLAGERESSEERARDCCWYNCVVTFGITHGRGEETPEAKARWFQSLTLEERMELLCEFTNLILENNPAVADQGHARQASGRLPILTLAQR